jgi:hypothetical protein
MASKLVLLNGSPRARSASGVLAGRIASRLTDWETTEHCIRELGEMPQAQDDLMRDIVDADMIVFSAPVYVGALPGMVIRFLESFANAKPSFKTPPGFLAITNCGFYEPYENDNALAVLKRFSEAAGLRWIGGFGVGCGGMIGARVEEGLHGAQNVAMGLDMAGDALAKGLDPPREAYELVRKPPIPKWLYLFMGNLSMAAEAGRHGNLLRTGARPYAWAPSHNGGQPRTACLLVSGLADDEILRSAVAVAYEKLGEHGWEINRVDVSDLRIRYDHASAASAAGYVGPASVWSPTTIALLRQPSSPATWSSSSRR